MAEKLTTQIIAKIITALAHSRQPKLDGEFRFAGLHDPVEIIRDKWGIPHIFASNNHDLFFAQGYVHAQDRLWQMDFNRRMIAGRLSEIIGEVVLPLDRWMRTLTLRRAAEAEQSLMSEESRRNLQSYADGVNACRLAEKNPVEFLLLRYKAEPWSIADSLSWIKMMAWSLSVNWEMEILRALLIKQIGPEKAAELEPFHLSRWPFIVPPGTENLKVDTRILDQIEKIRPFSGPSPYEGLGSNSWVVSGEWSVSGKPLLANDMHLGLTAPSIWYENHLSVDGECMAGISFPGIPGIISGHNGHVAWGFTNGFPDVQDLFIERLRRTDLGEYEAEYNNNWEKCRVIHEKIFIKGRKAVDHTVIITRHGPIINELAPDISGDEPLAMCWTALDPDTMINCLSDFSKAKTCTEFRNAARQWSTPSQNIVFADREGNIGYLLAGKIPSRKKGQGKLPVPGWTDEYEWDAYLPFEALPSLDNPERGFIVTANNRVIDAEYPVKLELEPITGDRAQRITEMIMDVSLRGGNLKIDIDYIKKMQYDLCSPTGRTIRRCLSKIQPQYYANILDSEGEVLLNVIRAWDGVLTPESQAALIYQVFIRELILLLLENKLSHGKKGEKFTGTASELTARIMGKGPTPILAEQTLFGDRCFSWVSELCSTKDSDWFDLGGGENRDQCFLLAFQNTINKLKKELGKDPKEWSWGKIHRLTINHPLGSNPILGSVFNIGPYPIGGDFTTIWASGTSYHNLETSKMVGPACRMIIDLSDFENSCAVMASGQSGNPASPHYRDQTQAWFKGEYHPMLINRSKIMQNKKHSLRFSPIKK